MTIKFVSIYNVTLAFGLLCATAGTEAATKYVNVNAVCASADGTLNKPFCTIQEAVDVTSLTVTPSILTPGGTIKIQATGLAQ